MLARDHHYLFSHVHLRNQALRSPDKVLPELSGPMREGFLFFLWQQVEEVAHTKVGAAGLNVAGVDQIGGGTLALVQMPPPERDTESLFAAIFVGPAGARYFVFDRSASEPGQATLAELELDDTRIHMGNHPATQAALLEVLARELSTPRPPSVRPTPPTVAMDAGSMPGVGSQPGVGPALGSQPGVMSQPGAPMARGPALPPGGRAKGKSSKVLAALGLVLLAPLFCCLGTAFMAYDSGVDEDAELTVETQLVTDDQDHERLTITIEGPEGVFSYRVSGPGASDCDYVSPSFATNTATCTVDLDAVATSTPEYHVVGRGSGPRLFGESLGDMVELEATASVQRTLGLRWSDAARTTVVTGFPGRLEVSRDGFLRLVDAPAGSTLIVAGETSAPVEPMVALDVPALTDQVGAAAVLRDGGRVSLANVSVRQPDGTTASGTAQLDAADLRPALVARLSELDDSLGAARGSSALWIVDGAARLLLGAPARIADIGRLVVSDSAEVPSGRCGPYALYGMGVGHRVPRTRWVTTVTVYDRVENRRVGRVRRFRGDRPSCPYSIATGTRTLHGTRDTTEADIYAREQLAPPADDGA